MPHGEITEHLADFARPDAKIVKLQYHATILILKMRRFSILPQECRKQKDGEGMNCNPLAMVAPCSPVHGIVTPKHRHFPQNKFLPIITQNSHSSNKLNKPLERKILDELTGILSSH